MEGWSFSRYFDNARRYRMLASYVACTIDEENRNRGEYVSAGVVIVNKKARYKIEIN